MLFSAVVTRVVRPLRAVEVADTPVVALLTVVSRAVISDDCAVIEPSAAVTRVDKPPTAVDVAATPVVE
jgi:hypothetical protein